MVAISTRKRRTWVRSRRGCKTCRLRHVKCDETYPSCKRCTSAGRACDGCAPSSDNWEVITISSESSSSSTTSISPSPEKRSRSSHYDGRESVSFAFFKQYTIEYLAGLLDDRWRPLVLRAVEQSDALYHASLAMGSMHKTILSKQRLRIRLEDDQYAIKQYTQSLRMLSPHSDDKTKTPIEIVLTACLLYIGFEASSFIRLSTRTLTDCGGQSLRGNHAVVVQHVRSGTEIMMQHLKDTETMRAERVIPLQSLVPAFARLERQMQEFTGSESPLIQALAANQTASGFFDYSGPAPQPVPYFQDIAAAWTSLHQRWHSLIAWVGLIHIDWFNHMGDVHKETNVYASPAESESVLLRRRSELTVDFALWKEGLNSLRTRLSDLTGKDEAIYTLLECHALLAQNILETATTPREGIWDTYADHFAQIVDLCRTAIEQEIACAVVPGNAIPAQILVRHRFAPPKEKSSAWLVDDSSCPLTFEMSTSMILFHVSMKCRDAQIRLAAIKLLEEYPRLEGLWDSSMMATAGREIDKVERQGGSLEEAAARRAPASEVLLQNRVVDMRAALHVNSRSGDLAMFTHGRIWEKHAVMTRVFVTW